MRTLRIYSLKNFSTDHIVHYLPSTYFSHNWKFKNKLNLAPLCDLCFAPFLVKDGQMLLFGIHILNTPSETMHCVGATIWEKSTNKTMVPTKRVICENK